MHCVSSPFSLCRDTDCLSPSLPHTRPSRLAPQDITHERAWLSSQVDQVVLKVVVETSGVEHTQELFDHLESEGYAVLQHPVI